MVPGQSAGSQQLPPARHCPPQQMPLAQGVPSSTAGYWHVPALHALAVQGFESSQWEGSQQAAQVPEQQRWVVRQTWPQVLQFALSVVRFTHPDGQQSGVAPEHPGTQAFHVQLSEHVLVPLHSGMQLSDSPGAHSQLRLKHSDHVQASVHTRLPEQPPASGLRQGSSVPGRHSNPSSISPLQLLSMPSHASAPISMHSQPFSALPSTSL